MSAILFRRFLASPLKVAYVLPSSKALIKRVLAKMDFARARVFVEFGAGEGCYTRELAKRLAPDAKLLVFELDPHLAEHLRKQFQDDDRVMVYAQDASTFRDELQNLGIATADYVLSGIPFSYLEPNKKKQILQSIHEGLASEGQFIVYQVTPELKVHTRMFAAHEVEYFLPNLPPMFILSCHKSPITLRAKPPKKAKREHRKNEPALR